MAHDQAFWKRVYTAFDPFRQLQANDPAWVDCASVRGDEDILTGLGKEIIRSEGVTCQLYAGHRGGGKSTELLRLKDYLQGQGYRVVYFIVDDGDLEPEDTEYGDILIACARQLLKALKPSDPGDRTPVDRLQTWSVKLWKSLVDLGLTELALEDVAYETPDLGLGKVSATIKTNISKRQQIRRQVELDADTLIDILNQFIREALNGRPTDRLLLIVDNLDRVVEKFDSDTRRSNYEQIFVNHSDDLKALDCHVIYTVPIPLVYSFQVTAVEERYKPVEVLPMVMVKTPDGQIFPDGVNKLKEMLRRRFKAADASLELEQAFESAEALEQLCLMSGGHVRNLMALMKAALQHTNELPIRDRSVKRAISELRDTYRRVIDENEWVLLAKVFSDKQIINNDQHRSLLFRRCILEYRYLQYDEVHVWHDIHPLIFGLDSFQRLRQHNSL
ncbi:MAG: AAA family ATPase [Cyanobacteria bacterium CRU_2_1]|nr:AAA family ATPase [Cyanobacteria bacterium RU_5_0]NJR62477.1 AAA family ATPase [Cyanobacteria bacterium CRU_2_1]